eukprot:g3867.t1
MHDSDGDLCRPKQTKAGVAPDEGNKNQEDAPEQECDILLNVLFPQAFFRNTADRLLKVRMFFRYHTVKPSKNKELMNAKAQASPKPNELQLQQEAKALQAYNLGVGSFARLQELIGGAGAELRKLRTGKQDYNDQLRELQRYNKQLAKLCGRAESRATSNLIASKPDIDPKGNEMKDMKEHFTKRCGLLKTVLDNYVDWDSVGDDHSGIGARSGSVLTAEAAFGLQTKRQVGKIVAQLLYATEEGEKYCQEIENGLQSQKLRELREKIWKTNVEIRAHEEKVADTKKKIQHSSSGHVKINAGDLTALKEQLNKNEKELEEVKGRLTRVREGDRAPAPETEGLEDTLKRFEETSNREELRKLLDERAGFRCRPGLDLEPLRDENALSHNELQDHERFKIEEPGFMQQKQGFRALSAAGGWDLKVLPLPMMKSSHNYMAEEVLDAPWKKAWNGKRFQDMLYGKYEAELVLRLLKALEDDIVVIVGEPDRPFTYTTTKYYYKENKQGQGQGQGDKERKVNVYVSKERTRTAGAGGGEKRCVKNGCAGAEVYEVEESVKLTPLLNVDYDKMLLSDIGLFGPKDVFITGDQERSEALPHEPIIGAQGERLNPSTSSGESKKETRITARAVESIVNPSRKQKDHRLPREKRTPGVGGFDALGKSKKLKLDEEKLMQDWKEWKDCQTWEEWQKKATQDGATKKPLDKELTAPPKCKNTQPEPLEKLPPIQKQVNQDARMREMRGALHEYYLAAKSAGNEIGTDECSF